MTRSEISNEKTCADRLTHAHLHTREEYFEDSTDGKRSVTMEA